MSVYPVLLHFLQEKFMAGSEGIVLMCCQRISTLRPAAIMKQQNLSCVCSLCNNFIVKDLLLPFSIAQYKMKRERRVGDK